MIKLFDESTGIIKGPSKHNENRFNYYHKSDRKDIAVIRDVLEKWFIDYPDIEKNELKNRFKKDMDSAFFELFLFELFRSLNFSIEIHPELKETKKRPDFLIQKDGFKAYVEAKVCYDKSESEMAFERRKNEFYDSLNKTRIKGFLLRIVKLDFKTKKQPSTKDLILKIEREVSVLDPELITSVMGEYGYEGCPYIDYENEDFKISIQPIPLVKSKRDKIRKKPIGMFPLITFWGGGEDSLRESIIKKAKRYGRFKIPYLICLNALGEKTSGKIDVDNVIWGSSQLSYSANLENRNSKTNRPLNGIFYNSGKPKLTNVSGILVTKVLPSNIPNANYWLFEHPFCENKSDLSELGLVYSYLKDNQIFSQEGNNFDKIFGIPKNWLS